MYCIASVCVPFWYGLIILLLGSSVELLLIVLILPDMRAWENQCGWLVASQSYGRNLCYYKSLWWLENYDQVLSMLISPTLSGMSHVPVLCLVGGQEKEG